MSSLVSLDLTKSMIPVASSKKSSEKFAKDFPVPAWRNIISCLDGADKRTCIRVTKRSAIVVLKDPSADLEKMQQKMAVYVSRAPLSTPRSYGPSHQFFFCDPTPRQQFISSIPPCALPAYNGENPVPHIQIAIQKDPNVAKTVQDVCDIESIYSHHIPIYHAMNKDVFVFSLFTRALLSTAYLSTDNFPCSVPIIRFPSLEGHESIEDFLRKYPMNSPSFNDHTPQIQKELLACNPHLFGNVTNEEESTWFYYTENQSIKAPDSDAFFETLCDQYKLACNQKDIERLKILYNELCTLGRTFANRNLGDKTLKLESKSGILLQILIPSAVIDQIAYASRAFGRIDTTTKISLSKRCSALRDNPLQDPKLQVRLLTQNIFVRKHYIEVFVHGCGGFFTEGRLVKPDKMSAEDWIEQEKLIARKGAILSEAREIFSNIILTHARAGRG